MLLLLCWAMATMVEAVLASTWSHPFGWAWTGLMPKHLFKCYLTEEKDVSVEENQGCLLPTQGTQWRCVGQKQVMLGLGDTVLSLRGIPGKIVSDIEVSEAEWCSGAKTFLKQHSSTLCHLLSRTLLTDQEKWAEGFCEHAIGCPELVF